MSRFTCLDERTDDRRGILADIRRPDIFHHPYVRAMAVLVALTILLVGVWSIWSPGRVLRLADDVHLHTFIETTSIVVCVLVFVTTFGAIGGERNRNLVLLGVAFLGVALFDFLHTQSDVGMPALVTPSSPSKAINFWLAARLLAAFALLAVAFLSWERVVPASRLYRWAAGMLVAVGLVSWVVLYRPLWVPETFVPSGGPTAFKNGAEVVIITVCLVAAVGFYQLAGRALHAGAAGARIDPLTLLCATIVTAMAEMFFTIYTEVDGLFDVLGHSYKVIGASFVFRGLVATNLSEAETRAKLALEAAELGAWSWEAATNAVELDPTATTFWGLPQGSRPTLTALDDLIFPDDRAAEHGAFRRALVPEGDRTYVAEYRIVSPVDGSVRHVASHGRTEFRVGKPVRIFGVVRDVTRRRQTERAVGQSEAHLSALVSIAADAIVSMNEQHRITLFNQGAEKIFGYSSDEVIGQPLDMLLPERFRRSHDDHVRQFGTSGAVARRMGERREIFGLRKDGTEFPAEAAISLLDLPTGPAFTAILRDITETKLASRRLETSVAERTQELREEIRRREEAQAALSRAQRMEAFGQLAGGVAHDFNNLLTVISGNQELLEMRLKDEKDLALLWRSQEAAEMGARLTARLLTFARRRQLEPTVLNLNEQISGMVELLRRSIGESVTLTTNLAPRIWAVRADPSEIENAVLNLAINARDAMPNGGTLVVETADLPLDEGDASGALKLPAGDYVRISMSDTGAGMTPEVIAHAFEPFFTTKPPGKGTGLGLSTIYGFVQQSGGTVTVSSELGRGTTINIYLPRVVGDQKITRSDRSDALPIARVGETVLLVEDRPDVRDVTRARLEQLGYSVVEADSGAAAIDLLQSGKTVVQLVFSDVVMPGGVSGYDLARWVQANRPALKVLLTSGFTEQVAGARDPDYGSVKLLRKPYAYIELARAIRDALDR